jgi:hypothetical protein
LACVATTGQRNASRVVVGNTKERDHVGRPTLIILQDRECTYSVILRRVHVSVVAVAKQ